MIKWWTMVSDHLLKAVITHFCEKTDSWLSMLSCMKPPPQIWWVPWWDLTLPTTCGSVSDACFYVSSTKWSRYLWGNLTKRGQNLWKLHMMEQTLNFFSSHGFSSTISGFMYSHCMLCLELHRKYSVKSEKEPNLAVVLGNLCRDACVFAS